MLYPRLVAGLIFGALSFKTVATEPANCQDCTGANGAWELTLDLTTHQFTSKCETDKTQCKAALTDPTGSVVCITDGKDCTPLGEAMSKVTTSAAAIPDGANWGGCSGTDHWGTSCAACITITGSGSANCKWHATAGCVDDSVANDVMECSAVPKTCDACPIGYAVEVALDNPPTWTSSCRPCQPRVTTDTIVKCVAGANQGTACTDAGTTMAKLFGDDWASSTDSATPLKDALCYAKNLMTDCTACKAAKDSADQSCVSLKAASTRAGDVAVMCVEDSEKALNAGFVLIDTCPAAPSACSKCTTDEVLKEVLDLTTQTVVSSACVAAAECTASAADPKAYTRCLAQNGPCPITPTVAPPEDNKPTQIDTSTSACFGSESSFKCADCVKNTDCFAYKVDNFAFCLPPTDYPADSLPQITDDKNCPAGAPLQSCADCSGYGGSFVVKTLPNFDTLNASCALDCALDVGKEADVTGLCVASDKCADVEATINSKILAGGMQQLPDTSCFAHARQTSCAKCTEGGQCKWDTKNFVCTPKAEDAGEILGIDSNLLVEECPNDAKDGSECAKCDSTAYMVSVRANSKTAVAGCVPGCPTDDEKNAFAPELGAVDCVAAAKCADDASKTFPNTFSYVVDPTTMTKTGDLALKDATCWGYTCPECFAATPPPTSSKADATAPCVYLNTPPPQTKDSTPEPQGTLYITQGCVPSEWWSKNKDTPQLQGKFEVVAKADSCPAEPTSAPGPGGNAAHGITVLSTLAVTALAALLL